MRREASFSVILRLFFFLILFGGFVGCSLKQPPLSDGPEGQRVTLCSKYNVDIPDGYTYIGKMYAYAYSEGSSPAEQIRDRFETFAFTREDGQVLLVQRNWKVRKAYHFRFLGGSKVEIDGRAWRNASYLLDTETTDKEYRKYISWLREKNVAVPARYRVDVQDKLATEFVLLRIMTFSDVASGKDVGDAPMPEMKSVKEYADSSCGNMMLPNYSKLYDQQKHFDDDDVFLP